MYLDCILCGKDNSRLLFKGENFMVGGIEQFNVVQCLSCGLIYLNPQPSAEVLQELYNEDYVPFKQSNKLLEKFQNMLLRKRVKKIKALVPAGGKILEVGCGTGRFLSALHNEGLWQVKGVELSPYAAEWARTNYELKVTTGTIFDLPYDNKYFDAIVMEHVLEHLPNPIEAVKRVHDLLRKDGHFIVAIPNAASPEQAIFGKYWYGWSVPYHLFMYNPQTLQRLLAKCDLKIVEVNFSVIPNNWAGSLGYFLREKDIPMVVKRFFRVDNALLLTLFLPLSLMFGFLKKSGRVQVVAKRRD